MKTNPILFLVAVLAAGSPLAPGQPAAVGTPTASTATKGNTTSLTARQADSSEAVSAAATLAGSEGTTTGSGTLRLNFRGAPLDLVLDYLSEAAGFIIVLEAQPKGTVDVWSDQPLTREEACNLLDSVLMKNGYAAVRKGRTLTIVNRDEAKTRTLPVKLGGDPGRIPQTEEMVTQIIPVRFIEVGQLIKDLQPLVSTRATVTANESANTIAITETQAAIHRVAEIIQALDSGAEDFTAVRVFSLQHADSGEMADLLSQLFPDESRNQNSQAPIQFGGFGGATGFGGPPGFSPGGAGAGGAATPSANSQKLRTRKRTGVVAVADSRTAAVVVSAPKDLMPQIERIVAELDTNPARKQNVEVFQLKNASAQEVLTVLQDLFQKSTTSVARNTATQTDPLVTRSTQQEQSNGANTQTGFGGNGLGGAGTGFGGGSSR